MGLRVETWIECAKFYDSQRTAVEKMAIDNLVVNFTINLGGYVD